MSAAADISRMVGPATVMDSVAAIETFPSLS
jgi:hypothetical protein